MNKRLQLFLFIACLIACITVVSALTIPVFVSEIDARTWVEAYKYPVFGTATIQSITSTVDDGFYSITYELAYMDMNDASSHKEVVSLQVRKPLPEDSAIESLVNTHALDFFDTVINRKPNPVISLTGSALIGKSIVIKRPVVEVVKEEEMEISP